MSIPNLDIDQWVQKILKTNKHNIVIQIKPKNLTKYTILWAQFMVMHATYYNTLVGKMVLYPIEVILDFWEETSYYWWGWQTWYNCKVFLPMKFIGRQVGKFNKSTMLIEFSCFPQGFNYWKVTSMTRMNLLMVNWWWKG
jgi:hypothetical protein